MRLEMRPRAVRDLVRIRDGLLKRAGEQAAERVRLHSLQRLERLRRKPDLGISTSHPHIRILSPTKYPYRIYFTATREAVVVLHIRHTSRRLAQLDQL